METSHPHVPLLKRKKTWIILLLIIVSGFLVLYFSGRLSSKSGAVQYVTSKVTTGSISASVSGNGQVISSEDIEIKAKASGEVSVLDMVEGQTIEKNTLVAKIDDIDAQRKVRDAKVDLGNSQLEMNKLYEPPTDLEIKRAESDITQAQNDRAQLDFNYKRDKQDAARQIAKLEADLPKAYQDAYNTISTIFVDLPYVMGDLDDLINAYDYKPTETNLAHYINLLNGSDNKKDFSVQEQKVKDSYTNALKSYKDTLALYQLTSRSDTDALESLTQKTYDAVYDVSQALKEYNILLTMAYDKVTGGQKNVDIAMLQSHLDEVSKDMGTVNPYLSTIYDNLSTAQDTLDSLETEKAADSNLDTEYELDKKTSDLTIAEKKQSLEELKEGPDELDVKAQQIKLIQKENTLADAEADLSDYSVYLPFDALISEVSVNKGDVVASSSSLGTAISLQKLAQITLNEIDIVNVKVGQKAVLTFDAVDNFSLTGEVAEIDATGAVDQGVVSYGVTISFDLDDERIKPGMSVSATLISESKSDALLLPSAAVKTQNNASYVEVLENGVPIQKPITTGLTSDTMVEIMSGLSEGEEVITSTIDSNAGAKTSSTTSGRSGFGGGAPGGIMIPR